jgi:hypothetical protein
MNDTEQELIIKLRSYGLSYEKPHELLFGQIYDLWIHDKMPVLTEKIDPVIISHINNWSIIMNKLFQHEKRNKILKEKIEET